MSPQCDHDFEVSERIFMQDTVVYDDTSPCQI